MNIYKGTRIDDFKVEVTVNGNPLPHVIEHSPSGLQWGYYGAGPLDLGFSVLAHHFNEKHGRRMYYGIVPSKAGKLYGEFTQEVISQLEDEWQLTTEDLETWLLKPERKAFVTNTNQLEVHFKDYILKNRNKIHKEIMGKLETDLLVNQDELKKDSGRSIHYVLERISLQSLS